MRVLLSVVATGLLVLSGCDAADPAPNEIASSDVSTYDIVGSAYYYYGEYGSFPCEGSYTFTGGTATSWSVTGPATIVNQSGNNATVKPNSTNSFQLTVNFSNGTNGSLTKTFDVSITRNITTCLAG